MTQQEINDAAAAFNQEVVEQQKMCVYIEDAFKAGAEWAMIQFVKLLREKAEDYDDYGSWGPEWKVEDFIKDNIELKIDIK